MNNSKESIKFVSATCPKCNGNLQLDSSLEIAFCQYCGAQCIVENAPKREKKREKLDIVLSFVERQQAQYKQEELLRKREKEQKRMERKENKKQKQGRRKEFFEKNWKFLTIIGIVIVGLICVCKLL